MGRDTQNLWTRIAPELLAGSNDSVYGLFSRNYGQSGIVRKARELRADQQEADREKSYCAMTGAAYFEDGDSALERPREGYLAGWAKSFFVKHPAVAELVAEVLPGFAYADTPEFRGKVAESKFRLRERYGRATRKAMEDAFKEYEHEVGEAKRVRAIADGEIRQAEMARLGMARRDAENTALRNEALPTLLGALEMSPVLEGMRGAYFDNHNMLTYATPGFLNLFNVVESDLLSSGIPRISGSLASDGLRKHERMTLKIGRKSESHTVDAVPIPYSSRDNRVGTLVLFENVDARLIDKLRRGKTYKRIRLLHGIFKDLGRDLSPGLA